MTREEAIELGHQLLRRHFDLRDVLMTIETASRLVGEQLETSENAILAMIEFIESQTNAGN